MVPSWDSFRIYPSPGFCVCVLWQVRGDALSPQTPFITICTPPPPPLPKLRTELVSKPQPYYPRLVYPHGKSPKYPPAIMWAFTVWEGKSFVWDWSCYPYEGLLWAHMLSWKAKSMLHPESLGDFFLDNCIHLMHSKLHFPTPPPLYPLTLHIHTKWPGI